MKKHNIVLKIFILKFSSLIISIVLLLFPLIVVFSFDIISLPFKKYLIYCVFIVALGGLFYSFLAPLHELGHFYVASHYNRYKKNKADLWLNWFSISASTWLSFNNKESRIILISGSLTKIIFCLCLLIISFFINSVSLLLILIYTIIIEIIFNCLPILSNSDSYKIIYIDKFQTEQKTPRNNSMNNFIQRKYKYLLFLGTITFFYCIYTLEPYVIELILKVS